jgi:hypothetical protein
MELPEGLYIMRGKSFQKNYTHEIPRMHNSTFITLSKLMANNEMSTLEKADWLSNNTEWVKNTAPLHYNKYVEWASSRESYTIRYFR